MTIFVTNRKISFAVLILVPILLGAPLLVSHGQNRTSSTCTDNQTCFNDGVVYGKMHGGLDCYAGMGVVFHGGMPAWFYHASFVAQENYCSGYHLGAYNQLYVVPGVYRPGTAGGVSGPMTAGLPNTANMTTASPPGPMTAGLPNTANMTTASPCPPGQVGIPNTHTCGSPSFGPGFVAPAGENSTNVTTTSPPQTQTTGSFVGEDFGDFHDIPLIGGLVSRHTGLLHNEQGIFVPWTVMCPRVQQFLVEQCSTLINPDGSLTSQGDRAIGCIRNGLAIAVANTHTINLPFGTLRGLLGGLAGATGCGGIVNLNQIQNTDMFQFLLHSVNIGP
jgi:hypothetical protein